MVSRIRGVTSAELKFISQTCSYKGDAMFITRIIVGVNCMSAPHTNLTAHVFIYGLVRAQTQTPPPHEEKGLDH